MLPRSQLGARCEPGLLGQHNPSPNAEVATISLAIRRDHFGRQRRGGTGERDRLGPRHNAAVCHGFLGRHRYGLPPIRVERQIVGRHHGVGCWRQGGGSHNLHKGADQWLYVVDGSGVAIINGHGTRLKAGTIVLIEAGDRHEIRNTGRTLLKTVSV